MLTLFTVPKPFRGHIKIIQTNAIKSWLELRPRCEIILFGDEEGVAEIANELGVRHIPEVECNRYGTPLISNIFHTAQKFAHKPLLCYVNTDIILMRTFMRAVEWVRRDKQQFLMVGRRLDVDIEVLLDFEKPDWDDQLLDHIIRQGKPHPPLGSDYFVFARDTLGVVPPFAVGRGGWDNWLIYRARSLRLPVIDVSMVTTVIHQNHDYGHVPNSYDKESWKGPETDQNRRLIANYKYQFTLLDATHLLTPKGLRWALDLSYLWRRANALTILYPCVCFPLQLLMNLIRLSYRLLARFGFMHPTGRRQ